MGTSLTGTKPKDTYDSLIKVGDNGPISGTAKYLSDGLGNDLPIAVSTSNVGIGTSAPDSKVRIQNDNATVPSLTIRDGGTPTVDHIRVSSGTYGDAFFVKATGNVGIGTSNPAAILELVGGTSTTNSIVVGNGDNATIASRHSIVFNIDRNNDIGGRVIEFRYGGNGYGGGNAIARFTSAGLCFGNDYAAANALDDYEEGTFTPSFAGSTTNPTVTYAARVGTYTKIGRQVTVSIELGTSANTGGVGTIQISGLPFTVGVRSYMSVATFNIDNTATTPMGLFAEINAGGTALSLLQTADNASWGSMDWTQATNASVYVNATLTYFV